jgi:hypothetical protein
MQDLIIKDGKCPSSAQDASHARFQWIWERDDKEQPPPWKETMYWDCLFTANLYLQGPLREPIIGAPPGFEQAYSLLDQQVQVATKAVKDIISNAQDLKNLLLSTPQLALAAGRAIQDAVLEAAGILPRDQELALLNEINGKLDIVIQNQQEILDEIASLKIYIDQALRNLIVDKMNGLQGVYRSLILEPPDEQHRERFVQFHDTVFEVANELGAKDPAVYITYGIGVGMVLTIEQLYLDFFTLPSFVRHWI